MAVDAIEIYQMVEQAFDANRKHSGKICEIPILGGHYVPGFDRTKRLKEKARRALLAREWFADHGPSDVQPLPLGHGEREGLKHGGVDHIVAWYARSLDCLNYDVLNHPSFYDYACGVMASEFCPNFIRTEDKTEELQRRFPPRPLNGLGPGLVWEPPAQHARAKARYRRNRTRAAS
jgi:hypothetical protein